MKQNFYKGRLRDNFNLEVIGSNDKDKKIVHDVICNKLCQSKIEN